MDGAIRSGERAAARDRRPPVSARRTIAALAVLATLIAARRRSPPAAAGGAGARALGHARARPRPLPRLPGARLRAPERAHLRRHLRERRRRSACPRALFEYRGNGQLSRSFSIKGQEIGGTHGIQAAISDSRGRMVLLDTNPARALTLNLRKHKQRTYARFPDLPTCSAPQPALTARRPRSTSRRDPQLRGLGTRRQPLRDRLRQATVWRVPPGGGKPELWLDLTKLDGVEFGTTGISLAADRKTLLIGQGSSAGGGDGNPTTGKIYEVPIKARRLARPLTKLWESQPTDLPDGFAIARSGRIYVPMVGLTAQIAVVGADGTELERFPETPLTGDNGSPGAVRLALERRLPRHAADRRQPERRAGRRLPPGAARRRGRRARAEAAGAEDAPASSRSAGTRAERPRLPDRRPHRSNKIPPAMAEVNVIDWHINPFRVDRWYAAWKPALDRAGSFGATSVSLTRSEDDPLAVPPDDVWENRADFDRYWSSDEVSAARQAASPGTTSRCFPAGTSSSPPPEVPAPRAGTTSETDGRGPLLRDPVLRPAADRSRRCRSATRATRTTT